MPDAPSSIREYSAQIREGILSITNTVESYLSEIEKRNDELNIVIRCFQDEAQRKAESLQEELLQGHDRGPMHGVPIGVKDIFTMSGYLPSAGSGATISCGDQEATVIRKLEASGAIILGTLNLDEFAAGGTGVNAWYGRCKNPLDRRRITGGSSSGSAAAVSAEFCLATIGSDAGGSIRIPAAFCGVHGLKPSYGRVSGFGAVPRTWSMDCIGPLASNTEDLGIVLEIISGHDTLDPSSQSNSDFTWARFDRGEPPRIGFLAGNRSDDEYFHHYEQVLESLKQAGYPLIHKSLDKLDVYTEYHQRIVKSEAAAFHRAVLERKDSNASPETQGFLRPGMQIPAIDYLQAQTQRDSLLNEFLNQVLNDIDVLVLPVSYEEAPIYETNGAKDVETINKEFARASIFTRFVNFLGLPAVSLPSGVGASGMPTAVQLIARPFDELSMLNIALAMEAVFFPANEH
tara:strand:- start:1391 stop:2770 length:1380 start_codon:yes stop_codon:yes gene_type:complete